MLALGALAPEWAQRWPVGHDSVLLFSAATVERLARLASAWTAIEVARGRAPTMWLVWFLAAATLSGTALLEPLLALSAVSDGNFNGWMAVNLVVLLDVHVIERIAGVVGVGYLLLGDSWKQRARSFTPTADRGIGE